MNKKTDYRLSGQDLILFKSMIFSAKSRVQTSSGVRTSSYPIGAEGESAGV